MDIKISNILVVNYMHSNLLSQFFVFLIYIIDVHQPGFENDQVPWE